MRMIGLACILLTARPAAAGDKDPPRIERIALRMENGLLTGDIYTSGLFSKRITGTIQSGLPAVVDLFYILTESGEAAVSRGVRSYSLKYDVWENIYSISASDSTSFFPTFTAMRSNIERLRSVMLVPEADLSPGHSYQVRVSVAVNPLKGTDEKKIEGWINETVRGEGGSSWHEQVLSVNDLIAHFFSREKGSPDRSEWFQSEIFKPEILLSRTKEDD